MNDTETEMRGLLAAATADVPPGIDLLDGLAKARRRDRARRTRGRVVLSAGVAAACISVFRPRLWATLTARPIVLLSLGILGVGASMARSIYDHLHPGAV